MLRPVSLGIVATRSVGSIPTRLLSDQNLVATKTQLTADSEYIGFCGRKTLRVRIPSAIHDRSGAIGRHAEKASDQHLVGCFKTRTWRLPVWNTWIKTRACTRSGFESRPASLVVYLMLLNDNLVANNTRLTARLDYITRRSRVRIPSKRTFGSLCSSVGRATNLL